MQSFQHLVQVVAAMFAALNACASVPRKAAAPIKAEVAVPTAAETTIASERFTRQISMFYRLDLHKDNAHAAAVAEVLSASDRQLRTCYTSRLNAVPALAGDLALQFSLSKATGSLQQIAQTGGSLKDKQMIACLKQTLGLLPFRPPYDMKGSLVYQFGVQNTGAKISSVR